jgi:hypothetical protein
MESIGIEYHGAQRSVCLVGSEGEVVAMAEFKLCTLPYIHLGESSTLRMTASG